MKKILVAAMILLTTGAVVNATGIPMQDKTVKTEMSKTHKKGKAGKKHHAHARKEAAKKDDKRK
ncbi:hypothetical protein [Niabella drilacis]|uniref:Pentapeptide MXKDX repeat protein n=1 Tax=Niabella drilacis (strain DSM 25811 / CCM 8410 / CCUG 62505 / LMG 26954 / E90) TaxID=1285928 RepID=A0A1G7AH50_NIADE|nr:hypothetical protein [Niabella drilacis]SDE14033.1 hypothetical protein SAMN04487894_12311 [Niabella drilacis]